MNRLSRKKARTTLIIGVLVVLGSTGLASALITDTNVGNQSLQAETVRGAYIYDSTLHGADLDNLSVARSEIMNASIDHATVRDSYITNAGIADALLVDSRLENVGMEDVTLRSVTLCNGPCALLSGNENRAEVHARLAQDAPAAAAPGESFDIMVEDAKASSLAVRSDPAGVTAFGFDPAAAPEAIAGLELWVDGEMVATPALGAAIDLPSEDFTLRVHVAENGIIDNSRLGIALALDDHTLRTQMTTLQVVATQLAFAPAEAQPFAPFLADSVGRLIVSVPTDANGNVDRDIDVAVTADVQDVAEMDQTTLVGDIDDHAAVHGDSEFLGSDMPLRYVQPTSDAAHHPATLELILRDTLGLDVGYGAANFHATHIVAFGPSETTVDYTASAVNANGETLTAATTIAMPPAAKEERTATAFGKDFVLPGEGQLLVKFVDSDGAAVESGEGWVLVITESPESHSITKRLAVDGESENEPLAGSALVGLPFGNFIASDYEVCLEHGGQTTCHDELVHVETGETSVVELTVE